jgi:uncharacterized membrane protein
VISTPIILYFVYAYVMNKIKEMWYYGKQGK